MYYSIFGCVITYLGGNIHSDGSRVVIMTLGVCYSVFGCVTAYLG